MTFLISLQRFELFRKYNGSETAFLSNATGQEKELFGNEFSMAWSKIAGILQDMEFVTQGMASADFQEDFLRELKTICEPAVLKELGL